LTIAGMVAGVVSLALLGKMIDSTTELVRLLRSPTPANVAVESGSADASAAELPSVEASVTPAFPPVEDVRLSVVWPLEKYDRPVANVVNVADDRDADLADARSVDAVASVDAGASTDVAVEVRAEAGPRAEPRDAAAAARLAAARPQSKRCGWLTCPEGQYCCNWNCAICANPGETCSSACGAPAAPLSAMCGPSTCNVGQVCCNESCGTCVPLGGSCSKEPCTTVYIPQSEPCGMRTCNVGEVCCNPSCGICTQPGGTCSQAPCP
jgi:hypothetical protein